MDSSHDAAIVGHMNDRSAIAWLARRVGFGLGPGELDALAAAGVSAMIDRLVDPDAHGVEPAPDPWQSLDADLASYDVQNGRRPAAARSRSRRGWRPCS